MDTNLEENEIHSRTIVQNFIDISSDMYHQEYAWDEMNSTMKEVYAPRLMQANENISYRYEQDRVQ